MNDNRYLFCVLSWIFLPFSLLAYFIVTAVWLIFDEYTGLDDAWNVFLEVYLLKEFKE